MTIFTNLVSAKVGELDVTRGTCLIAKRIKMVAVDVLLCFCGPSWGIRGAILKNASIICSSIYWCFCFSTRCQECSQRRLGEGTTPASHNSDSLCDDCDFCCGDDHFFRGAFQKDRFWPFGVKAAKLRKKRFGKRVSWSPDRPLFVPTDLISPQQKSLARTAPTLNLPVKAFPSAGEARPLLGMPPRCQNARFGSSSLAATTGFCG